MDKNKLIEELELYIEDNYFEIEMLSCASRDFDFNEPILFKLEAPCPLEKRNRRKLEDVILELEDTFQEALFRYIDNKGINEVDVYTNARIDRRLFSKIRSNVDYKPNKKTAIALCIGLKLNLDETLDLLKKAGYTLSHSSRFDLIIEYLIKNKEYDMNVINDVLYEMKEEVFD